MFKKAVQQGRSEQLLKSFARRASRITCPASRVTSSESDARTTPEGKARLGAPGLGG